MIIIVWFVSAVIGFFVAVRDRDPTYEGISKLFLGAYPHRAVKAWMGTSIVLLLLFLASMYVPMILRCCAHAFTRVPVCVTYVFCGKVCARCSRAFACEREAACAHTVNSGSLVVFGHVACATIELCDALLCSLLGYKWYVEKIDIPEDHDSEVDDRIPANAAFTFSSKYWRRVSSVLACVLMCVAQVCHLCTFAVVAWEAEAHVLSFVQGAIVYGVQKGLQRKEKSSTVYVLSSLLVLQVRRSA